MEKLKVLYAEDDPLTVMEVAEQLEEKGFEVIVATNGTEALKLFRERQPNVVLLDVDMPGHNGFEVLQIIRLTDHYTPIVIYSSLGDEANQMRGLESGAYTYLVKNCAPAVVAAQVYNCLSKNGSDKICLGEKSFFDLLSGELWIGERKEKLVGLEFKIFTMLCRNREKTVSRELLIKAGWDKDDYKLHLQLNKYISILRHKISLTSASIVTDKFNGYMLKVTR